MQRLPLLLLGEGSTFVLASLVHRGLLAPGYAHARAAVPETVIGAALLAGAAVAAARPARARAVGLAAQGFALAGTLVGITMVAIGVGPRTPPDLAYHAGILAVLGAGVVSLARRRGRRAAAYGQPGSTPSSEKNVS